MHLLTLRPLFCQQFLYRLHDPQPHGPAIHHAGLHQFIGAAIEAHDCKSPFAEVGRTEIMLLASVLAVVERLAWVPPRASVVVKKVGLR